MTEQEVKDKLAKIEILMADARDAVREATKLADEVGMNIHLGIGDVSQTYRPKRPPGGEEVAEAVDEFGDPVRFSEYGNGYWANSYQY